MWVGDLRWRGSLLGEISHHRVPILLSLWSSVGLRDIVRRWQFVHNFFFFFFAFFVRVPSSRHSSHANRDRIFMFLTVCNVTHAPHVPCSHASFHALPMGRSERRIACLYHLPHSARLPSPDQTILCLRSRAYVPSGGRTRLPLSNGSTSTSGAYVNSPAALEAAREADACLPEGLYEACSETGRTPTVGEVKMVYYTKVIYMKIFNSGYRRLRQSAAAAPQPRLIDSLLVSAFASQRYRVYVPLQPFLASSRILICNPRSYPLFGIYLTSLDCWRVIGRGTSSLALTCVSSLCENGKPIPPTTQLLRC